MQVKDLPMIGYIEKTINDVVADEIEKGLLNEESPKIIAFLDVLSLSSYILEKDIEGEFLTLYIDEKRCLNEYQKQLTEWKSERSELVNRYFNDKGVY